MADDGLTRRDILAAGAATAMGLALGRHAAGARLFSAENPTSTVVLIRREDAVTGGHQVNAKVVAEMIDEAVAVFAGVEDPAEAWARYVKPDDVAGVKISRCQWMRVYVEQATIDAVRARVSACGVADDRLHVKDMGFPAKACTAVINVPSIKVHRSVGIAASIKNYINLFTKKCSQFHKGLGSRLGENRLHPDNKGQTRLIRGLSGRSGDVKPASIPPRPVSHWPKRSTRPAAAMTASVLSRPKAQPGSGTLSPPKFPQ